MTKRTLINDRYELEDLPIGRGGMGEVWGGRDTKLDREIAVKFIRFPGHGTDQDFVRRFVRESRITARLQHPGVPAVYDVGTHEGRPFLVMQRIRGISLSDLSAEQGALPIGWAAAIAAQICSVLAVAHRASLVHRDLKPSNVILEADGGVKVLDFGLAAAPTLPDFSTITQSGQPIGTPQYMAPEQIVAEVSGPHTDLYALGCTLYELIAGAPLFTGSTSYSVMSRQVSEPPRALRGVRPDVPVDLDQLVLELLEKRPEDRPASAEVVFDRLLPHVGQLGPLSGALRPRDETSPVRMYASVLSRVFADAAPRPASAEPGSASGATGSSSDSGSASGSDASASQSAAGSASSALAGNAGNSSTAGGGGARATTAPQWDSGRLKPVRAEAAALIAQSRFSQAASVLAEAVDAASRGLGPESSEVVELRLALADARFDAGDYRSAAPDYRAAVAGLVTRHGADDDAVLRCRLREATCHALVGDSGVALRQLDELLHDHSRVFGASDPRTLDIRRQLGLLQLGAGQRDEAVTTLDQLLAELSHRHGAADQSVVEVRDLLDRMRHASPS